MTSVALVSSQASGESGNSNTSAMLTARGHTVTFFDDDAVTSSNLAGFGLIYCNRVVNGKTTLAERVAKAVAGRGIRVKVLDLAAMRRFLLQEAPAVAALARGGG